MRLIGVTAMYAAMILLAELTFGNPAFLANLWAFQDIAAYKWSVPIHTVGFVWTLFVNSLFLDMPLYVPVLGSVGFFLAAELLNLLFLHIFEYAQLSPLGPYPSFIAVILLYTILCAVCSFFLRSCFFKHRQRHDGKNCSIGRFG